MVSLWARRRLVPKVRSGLWASSKPTMNVPPHGSNPSKSLAANRPSGLSNPWSTRFATLTGSLAQRPDGKISCLISSLGCATPLSRAVFWGETASCLTPVGVGVALLRTPSGFKRVSGHAQLPTHRHCGRRPPPERCGMKIFLQICIISLYCRNRQKNCDKQASHIHKQISGDPKHAKASRKQSKRAI